MCVIFVAFRHFVQKCGVGDTVKGTVASSI